MDATVLGQYKPSLHLPHVIWDLKMEKKKKSSVKGGIEPRSIASKMTDTRFTIYATGLIH